MEEEKIHPKNDAVGESAEEAVLTRPNGENLPKPLDPIVTMAVVKRYIESERGRNRKMLLWSGAFFLFMALLILALFIWVGVFVLRNAKRATDVANLAQEQTAVYATEVMGISNDLKRLEHGHADIQGKVKDNLEQQSRQKRVLYTDLKRFSRWVESLNTRDREALSALQERLREMEQATEEQTEALAKLKKEYEALLTSASGSEAARAAGPVAEEAGRSGVVSEGGEAAAEAAPSISPSAERAEEIALRETASAAAVTAAYEVVKQSYADAQDISTVTLPNGDSYQGQFKDGLFDGWGIYTYSDGGRYEGEFKNDKRDGKGTMIYANGNKYVGDFRKGMKDGVGRLTFYNGDAYEGEFQEDERTGRGTYFFSNGAKYEGEFKNGRRHGQGTYTYPGGEKYIGEFLEGKKHGEGTCVYPDGRQIKALWSEDRFMRRI